MNRKLISASVAAGLMLTGSAAFAGANLVAGTECLTVNGTNGVATQNGFGEMTCVDPSPERTEGALWVAGEQAISIVAAAIDAYGCFNFGNPALTINTTLYGAPNLHARAEVKLGTAQFTITERANLAAGANGAQRGLRRFDGALDPLGVPDADTWTKAGAVGPGNLTQLDSQFNTDQKLAIMHGDANFDWFTDQLDEHIIKDFFKGEPVAPEFSTDCSWGTTLAAASTIGLIAARDEFLSTADNCALTNAATTDYAVNNPFTTTPPYVAYDNGLEVTTKKYTANDLLTAADDAGPGSLFEGGPIGKWRQISRYRRPNGSNGQLRYTKVRIAPWGVPQCAIQLDGTVTGNASSQQQFVGTVTIYDLTTAGGFY